MPHTSNQIELLLGESFTIHIFFINIFMCVSIYAYMFIYYAGTVERKPKGFELMGNAMI